MENLIKTHSWNETYKKYKNGEVGLVVPFPITEKEEKNYRKIYDDLTDEKRKEFDQIREFMVNEELLLDEYDDYYSSMICLFHVLTCASHQQTDEDKKKYIMKNIKLKGGECPTCVVENEKGTK